MTITKNILGNKAELKLSGWLDTQTSPQLEAELMSLEDGINSLVLDFAEVEYISSAGMRQLVSAYKKMNGNLTLTNVSDEIMSVISMTGLDKRIKFE
jgi:anti-sigma B factor antagonist